jgi:hypothetical protein
VVAVRDRIVAKATIAAAIAFYGVVVPACVARPPTAGQVDSGVASDTAPRSPSCQPGIRETGCTPLAPPDAGDSGAIDVRIDDTRPALDVGALDVGSASDGPTDVISDGGSKSDTGNTDGAATCQPTSGGIADNLRLVDVQPRQVTTHVAVMLTVKYEGELPPWPNLWVGLGKQTIHINPGLVDTNASSFKIQFPGESQGGPRRLSLLTGPLPPALLEVAWLDCAVQVMTRPAKPVLLDPPQGESESLAIPLHPELSRPCARTVSRGVSNEGDDPITVRAVELAGSAEFTFKNDSCTGHVLGYNGSCSVQLCFTSTTSGNADATLTFHTSAGDLTSALRGTVLRVTDGLDRSFAGMGGRFLENTVYVRNATLLNNRSSVAIWDQNYALLFVAGDGGIWLSPIGAAPTVPSFVLNWLCDVRAGGPGQGIYALISPNGFTNAASLVRFFDDGTRDPSFGDSGMVRLDDVLIGQYSSVEVQPTGRVLVIGGMGVRAYDPTGVEVTSYRTPVTLRVDESRASRGAIRAVDATGRLYVRTTSGVVRLQIDGGIDPTFSFVGPAEAMTVDRDQRLLVTATGKLSRLDETGGVSSIPLVPQPELAAAMTGIAVDAQGRILLTSSTGAVVRYHLDGTTDGRVGFAEGGAIAVICPRQGGCLIAGTLSEGEVDIARPSGTTLDEGYALRLAP